MKRYLDHIESILIDRSGHAVRVKALRDFDRAASKLAMHKELSWDAGGPSNFAVTDASVDSGTISSTGTEGGEAGVAASSEDDSDGDGDPDSDRRKLTRILQPAHSAPAQSATSKRILRMPAVQVRIGLSRSTIYESISKGEFPPSISLGARAVGWLESDIDAWLESRVSASKTVFVAGFRPERIYSARTQSAKLSLE